MPKHTDRNFAQDLHDLKDKILKMGALVETMIARSITSLVERDSNLAREVIHQDKEVDALEMEIDDACLRILALHQPAAVDLRFVAVGMKISTDLERMGDLAVNICEEVLVLNQWEPLKPYIDLPEMAKKSQAMVKGALQAFIDRDAARAKGVCESDDEVDNLEVKIKEDLTQIMQEKQDAVPRGIRLMMIARQLERIGDHATNVAEEVNFLVEGEDIRHGASALN
ncbi:MAG: phosphate signaling complex protein PhoU [bacterium]|nr:phosphate signaling complex protein PhoU [bacterium]